MAPRVLIIEHDPALRASLRSFLVARAQVVEAADAHAGLHELSEREPSLIVLDLQLPPPGGLEALRRIREATLTPVLVLTPPGSSDAEKRTALDAGADDYLAQPFLPEAFLERVFAASRRPFGAERRASVRRGSLEVDLVNQRVSCRGHELKLTPTEHALVRVLVRHPGRILTHRQLLREVWGSGGEGHRQYLPVYLRHLHSKIEHDPAAPELIRPEGEIGYRFAAE